MTTVAIFDLVGTLVSVDPVSRQMGKGGDRWFQEVIGTAMAATLAGRYLPFREALEITLTNLLEKEESPETSVPELLKLFRNLPVAAGALTALRHLQERGVRMAVLTNSARGAAMELLQNSGLSGFFEMITSTDDVERCKPHPATYRLALDRLDAEPEEAWLIATHAWDIYGASAAGLRSVWVMTHDRRWPFPGVPPGATITELNELPGVLT